MTNDRWGAAMTLGERRVLHPGPLRWLRALGWMLLLYFATSIGAGLVTTGVEHVLPKQDLYRLIANIVGVLVCLGLYALLVWGGEARKADEISPIRAPLGLLSGIVIGVVMFASVMGIMAVFGLYDIAWRGEASPLQALSKSLESGVVEEILVRAVMLRLIWRAFGPWVAFGASALLFGAGHLANPNATPFAAIAIAVEAGIMLGAFYVLTGRLWVSIGVHAAWNFTQGYLFGAAVSGTQFGPSIASSVARAGRPEILTGGAFGPEASLPGLFVGTLVGVVVLWLAWKAGRFKKAEPAVTPAEPAVPA